MSDGDSSASTSAIRWRACRGVRAALWGDIDDDGLIDVVLLRRRHDLGLAPVAGRALARRDDRDAGRHARGSTPSTARSSTPTTTATSTCGWSTAAAPTSCSTTTATARSGASRAQAGLAGDGRPSRGVAVADLDGDRDHDLVVLKAAPPHEVFLNDRVWSYRPAPGLAAVRRRDTRRRGGRRQRRRRPGRALHRRARAASSDGSPMPAARGTAARSRRPTAGPRVQLAIADVNGDGDARRAWRAEPTAGRHGPRTRSGRPPVADQSAVTVVRLGGGPSGSRPGDRRSSASANPAWSNGRPDRSVRAIWPSRPPGARSPAISGARTPRASARGSRSARDRAGRPSTPCAPAQGPGQSLQPVAVGLGGARPAPTSCRWSGPTASCRPRSISARGRLHRIEETQRQLSSCPVLFAFDGTALPLRHRHPRRRRHRLPRTARRLQPAASRTNGCCCPRRRSPRMTAATR